MSDKTVMTGKARGMLKDEAEAWLKANDPHYKKSRKSWISPGTDALSKINSEANTEHPSFDDTDARPDGSGNRYRRQHLYGDSLDERNAIEFAVEDDYDEDSRP